MFRAGARANFQDAEKMEEQVSSGWRTERTRPSLAEVHRTIPIARDAGFWRKLLAFSGPGYLVCRLLLVKKIELRHTHVLYDQDRATFLHHDLDLDADRRL